jgi:hypothetical protein
MRLTLALLTAAFLATALSGCTAGDDPAAAGDASEPFALQGEQFEGSAIEGEPAGEGSPASHGAPVREEGPVEVGMDATSIPGAYARRAVTITNSFDGADQAAVELAISSGSLTVLAGDSGGYRVEALLEARGLTEQDAREALDRLQLVHDDAMEPDGLHLATRTERTPRTPLVPGITVSSDNSWADVTLYLPAGPAYRLAADSSSGDISVSGLRGPSFLVDASSGSVHLEGLNARDVAVSTSSGDLGVDGLQAQRAEFGVSSGSIQASALRIDTLVVDSSSGDVGLEGVIDTLEVDSSSGNVDIDAHGRESGAYLVTASSGSIAMRLLHEDGRAYRVTADTSSGTVEVDLPNSRSSDDAEDGEQPEHVEAESRDFDDASIRTTIAASTSSGDIRIG